MVICFTALYLNDTAQYELCTVQHARFVLATIVCTVAHSATAPCTFYHGSSRYCHGEKLVPHKDGSWDQIKVFHPQLENLDRAALAQLEYLQNIQRLGCNDFSEEAI